MGDLTRLGRISKASLADSVYQSLLDAILTGQLAGGAELSEVSLAAELGLSRTPVHEAIGRLAKDGLVEQTSGRQPKVVSLSSEEIAEIYEMRLLLEPAAAERAATRLEEAELAALRETADALDRASNSKAWAAKAIEFDIRFHDALASASGNERLRADITKYRHLVRAFCRMSGSSENLRDALREHREILDALEARNASGARKAMASHIKARLQAVLAEIEASAAKQPA